MTSEKDSTGTQGREETRSGRGISRNTLRRMDEEHGSRRQEKKQSSNESRS